MKTFYKARRYDPPNPLLPFIYTPRRRREAGGVRGEKERERERTRESERKKENERARERDEERDEER